MFELPVLIFLLTAIGVVTPRFLLRHSRYAILAIFILAALVTQTSDVVNLTLLAGPMCALFALGVGASYLLVWQREGRVWPVRISLASAAGTGAAGYFAWRRWRRR
jgi:sec-independent protein translocase protein TatC